MAQNNRHWEHFDHRAEIGVAGFGPSAEAAFEQAALALTAILCDPGSVREDRHVEIRCEESDRELLLVDWLNAVIYKMATLGLVFSRFDVRLDGAELFADAWGEPLDPDRHRPAAEIKGATYTELELDQRSDGGWVARTVVDV